MVISINALNNKIIIISQNLFQHVIQHFFVLPRCLNSPLLVTFPCLCPSLVKNLVPMLRGYAFYLTYNTNVTWPQCKSALLDLASTIHLLPTHLPLYLPHYLFTGLIALVPLCLNKRIQDNNIKIREVLEAIGELVEAREEMAEVGTILLINHTLTTLLIIHAEVVPIALLPSFATTANVQVTTSTIADKGRDNNKTNGHIPTTI